MGSYSTKCAAVSSIAHMRKIGFMPKTLLNIGIGGCPELRVWRRGLKGVRLFGVDIRNKGWDAEWKNAFVSNSKDNNMFCWSCKSLKCVDPTHIKVKYEHQVTTIDDLVEENKLEPPFFMWMDIEGGELDALQGASKTLLNTPVINLEMREFAWTTNNKQGIHEFLVKAGYMFIDIGLVNGIDLEDKIYQRIDYKGEIK